MSFIVAIDGPAGAGKSTLARRVAERLNLVLVDTGAIYRSVALRASREGVDFGNDAGLAQVVDALDIAFRFEGGVNRVFLGEEDVTSAIRSREISLAASQVSSRPTVRSGLLELQRRLAKAEARGAVLEGRDIGTVVFPDAQLKIFLTASPESRAARRHAELVEAFVKESGVIPGPGLQESKEALMADSKTLKAAAPPNYEEILAEITARDHVDESRALAPLKPAQDAHWVDTTTLGPDEVVERVVELARLTKGFPG